MRHCRTLFKKHVLPLLNNPDPILNLGGQAVSTSPVYRDCASASNLLTDRLVTFGERRGDDWEDAAC